ncbi:hypothetical protein KIN20_021329 [Parelaphostrongylus tenuis]|uniref:Uncharacterized protein n=1 Tax=Parelaphostrongylus tenuis TaxID=148309 RepID=A0AAD5N498_PARTN|nr:hypothetical protein KIN20_021329 [Parelaphostrongylus tenuis]
MVDLQVCIIILSCYCSVQESSHWYLLPIPRLPGTIQRQNVIASCKLEGEWRRLRYEKTDTQRRHADKGPTTTTVERLQLAHAAVYQDIAYDRTFTTVTTTLTNKVWPSNKLAVCSWAFVVGDHTDSLMAQVAVKERGP